MFKRSGIWWTCISHNGRKIQKSLETSDKKLAKAIEAKVRTEIVEGKYYERLIGQSKTFKDMMDKFMKDYAPTVSMNTQEGYKYYLKNLNRFFGNPGLLSITPKIEKTPGSHLKYKVFIFLVFSLIENFSVTFTKNFDLSRFPLKIYSALSLLYT